MLNDYEPGQNKVLDSQSAGFENQLNVNPID